MAFGQPEGTFLPLASLGGTPLVAFAVTLSGFALTALLRRVRQRSPRRAALAAAAAAMVALPPLAGLAAMPLVSSGPQVGTATAAVIQGNVPRLGLDFNAQRRAVLDNHVARTDELAADVAVGRVARPDFVIWPENSSDIDPSRNPDAAAVIDRAVRAIGAPVLVGAVGVTTQRRAAQHRDPVGAGGGTDGQLRQASAAAVRGDDAAPIDRAAVQRGRGPGPPGLRCRQRAGCCGWDRRWSAWPPATKRPSTGWCGTASASEPRYWRCPATTPHSGART